MNFGQAIEAMKHGARVARKGWNGKGMWIVLVGIDNYIVTEDPPLTDGPDNIRNVEVDVLPWIGMYTADEKFVPWLASQTDMLAEDWQLVDGMQEKDWRKHIPVDMRSGLISEYDDGSAVFFAGATGGGSEYGSYGRVKLMKIDADGAARFRDYTADADWYQ